MELHPRMVFKSGIALVHSMSSCLMTTAHLYGQQLECLNAALQEKRPTFINNKNEGVQ